jgi:hypothetical protein
MAKEVEEKESKKTREREGGKKDGEGEREEGGKKEKAHKHLHSIRTEAVVDHKGKTTGYISHHTYKAKATDHHSEPEKPMATHDSAEEAGQHVAEQMGAQEGGGGQEPEEEAQAQPAQAGGGAGEPEPGM